MAHKPLNSAIVIAKLLSCEGFSDFTANEIERYWKRNSGLTDRQLRQLKRLDEALTKLAAKLEEGERRVLGRFIGLHKKMSFDTGLRMGLTAYAVQTAKLIPGRDPDRRERIVQRR